MSGRGASSSLMDMSGFYAGRSVLVTGASGFLGKVIVEKLLHSLPDLDKVYVLIRPNQTLDAVQRWQKLIDSPIFSRIRRDCSDQLEKVRVVSGDLQKSELAINAKGKEELCANVSVVLHCAATVKFDEALRTSVEMNVIGTQRLMTLCRNMSKLAAFVHASTAYANCDRHSILESVYPPPIHPEKLIDALSWMSDAMVESITPLLVGARPNTYTLTKALAECTLLENAGNMPCAIVRPSIIGATWKEPLPGWTDNLNGPTGLFAAMAKGILTNMTGNVNARADIIPVDIVSNMLIAVAWHRAQIVTSHVPVINCCSGELNAVYWGYIVNYLEMFFTKLPVDNALRHPSAALHENSAVTKSHVALKHLLPAYIIDGLGRLMGKKPRMVRLYGKLDRAVTTLEYFTSHEWQFQSAGAVDLVDHMSDKDKLTFACDVRDVSWTHYLHNYMFGVKKYILKDDFRNVGVARLHINRLKWLSISVNLAGIAAFVQVLMSRYPRYRRWLVFLCAAFVQMYSQLYLRPNDVPLAVSQDELERAIAQVAGSGLD